MAVNLKNPAVGVPVVLVVLALAGFIGWRTISGGRGGGSAAPRGSEARMKDVYYYDLNAGKLFVGDPGKELPFLAPSQKEGDEPLAVLANVWSCGDCSKERFVGYVVKMSDEGRQAFQKIKGNMHPEAMRGLTPEERMAVADRLVAKLAADGKGIEGKWVYRSDMEGAAIADTATEGKCPSGTPVPCAP